MNRDDPPSRRSGDRPSSDEGVYGSWNLTLSQARSAARAKVALDRRRGRPTDPRVKALAESGDSERVALSPRQPED